MDGAGSASSSPASSRQPPAAASSKGSQPLNGSSPAPHGPTSGTRPHSK
jgi:hypothetical protein